MPHNFSSPRPAFDSTTHTTYGSLLTSHKTSSISTLKTLSHTIPPSPTLPKHTSQPWTSASRTRRLFLELKTAMTWAPWLSIAPLHDDLNTCIAHLEGPYGTPYEGGIFSLLVQFPERYPFESPSIRFLNKVWHPCIDAGTGEVMFCGDSRGLREGWTASWTIVGLLSTVVLLFGEVWVGGFSDRGRVEEVMRMWRDDRRGFEGKAREWTELFAKDKVGEGFCPDVEEVERLSDEHNVVLHDHSQDDGNIMEVVESMSDASSLTMEDDDDAWMWKEMETARALNVGNSSWGRYGV